MLRLLLMALAGRRAVCCDLAKCARPIRKLRRHTRPAAFISGSSRGRGRQEEEVEGKEEEEEEERAARRPKRGGKENQLVSRARRTRVALAPGFSTEGGYCGVFGALDAMVKLFWSKEKREYWKVPTGRLPEVKTACSVFSLRSYPTNTPSVEKGAPLSERMTVRKTRFVSMIVETNEPAPAG
jgi:hypothetical protein